MKLTRARIIDLDSSLTRHNGATFPCHETLDYNVEPDEEPRHTEKTTHCAGALAYIEKHGVSSQMMRIAERLGMYDRHALMAQSADLVWDDLEEWLAGGTCP